MFIHASTLAQLTGEIFSGSIKTGSSPNTVIIFIKPSASFSGKFSNIQFNIQIPDYFSPAPTAFIKNNFLSNYLPSSNFIYTVTNEGGFLNYLFNVNCQGSSEFFFQSGVPIRVIEVEFTGGPLGTIAYSRLGHLDKGGDINGQLSFYVEVSGNDNTNYSNMFYGNGASNHGNYSGYSFVPIQNMVIPLSDIDLHIFNKKDDALIKWDVINQKDNVIKYEVERSLDGFHFQPIGNLTPNSQYSYQYYDQQISSLVMDEFVFYRIKESNNDNTTNYSETKSLELSSLTRTSIFPVPCHEQLSIKTISKFDRTESIKIKDITGKLLITKITKFQKGNNVINIDVSNLPNGTYLIFIGEGITYLKKFVKI
jgi:hypothetical protein